MAGIACPDLPGFLNPLNDEILKHKKKEKATHNIFYEQDETDSLIRTFQESLDLQQREARKKNRRRGKEKQSNKTEGEEVLSLINYLTVE